MFDISSTTYTELKATRDQIEARLRELERTTLDDIEQKLRDFGLSSAQPKQRRKRRTKLEIEADKAREVS